MVVCESVCVCVCVCEWLYVRVCIDTENIPYSFYRVGAQLGLTQMITIEIKIPNRLVGLGMWC